MTPFRFLSSFHGQTPFALPADAELVASRAAMKLTPNERMILELVLTLLRQHLHLWYNVEAVQKMVCSLLPGELDPLKHELLDEIARNESRKEHLEATLRKLEQTLSDS